jgi:hypothetical protein
MGRLIRLGEWMRFKKGSHWNHEFIISDKVDENGEPLVIQATLRGVTDTVPLSQVAPGGRYLTMPPPDGVDRHKMLVFATSQVGIEYGFLTILAIAIDIVTWDWFPSFRGARKQSWICSALVEESMRYGGYLRHWVNIYTVTPAESYFVRLFAK